MNELIRFSVEQQASAHIEKDWEDFQERLKINPCNMLGLGTRIDSLKNSPYLRGTMAKSYKHYPNCPQILLPIARLTTDMQMEEIICKRRSVRQFSIEKCSIEELANILQLSYGITGEGGYANQDFKQYFRAVPSGGALYPLEVYIGALNVDKIATGVYHYRVAKHALELLREVHVSEALKNIGHWDGVDVYNSSFFIFISAIFERCTFKYGNRGYRFSLLEVGFVSMMMDLVANAMGTGVCHLGGFYDNLTNEFLGLNGVTESVQTVLCFGKKPCGLTAGPGH